MTGLRNDGTWALRRAGNAPPVRQGSRRQGSHRQARSGPVRSTDRERPCGDRSWWTPSPPDGAAPGAMRTVTTTRSRMADLQRTKPVSAAPGRTVRHHHAALEKTTRSRPSAIAKRRPSPLRPGTRSRQRPVPPRTVVSVLAGAVPGLLEKNQSARGGQKPPARGSGYTERCTERQTPTQGGVWLEVVQARESPGFWSSSPGSRCGKTQHPPAWAPQNRTPPGAAADPPRPGAETRATAGHGGDTAAPGASAHTTGPYRCGIGGVFPARHAVCFPREGLAWQIDLPAGPAPVAIDRFPLHDITKGAADDQAGTPSVDSDHGPGSPGRPP